MNPNPILQRIEHADGFWTREFAYYLYEHQHPLNRLSHMIGVPIIVGTGVLSLATLNLPLFVGGQVVGWTIQVIGHRIEGNRPVLVKHPVRALVLGPLFVLVELLSALGVDLPFILRAHELVFGTHRPAASSMATATAAITP